MVLKQKIRQIGNSQGIILPKKILELFNFNVGEKLILFSRNDQLVLAKEDGMHDKTKKVRR